MQIIKSEPSLETINVITVNTHTTYKLQLKTKQLTTNDTTQQYKTKQLQNKTTHTQTTKHTTQTKQNKQNTKNTHTKYKTTTQQH